MTTALPENLLAELAEMNGIPPEQCRRFWTAIVESGLATVQLIERPDGSIGEGFVFERSTVVYGLALALHLWQAEVERWRVASMN